MKPAAAEKRSKRGRHTLPLKTLANIANGVLPPNFVLHPAAMVSLEQYVTHLYRLLPTLIASLFRAVDDFNMNFKIRTEEDFKRRKQNGDIPVRIHIHTRVRGELLRNVSFGAHSGDAGANQ